MSDLLSKSTFIRSLQCQKSLYLYKRHYNLRDDISAEQQAVFDRGHAVGFLARDLFPGGVDAGWDSPVQYKKSVEKTRLAMQSGAKVIYEAAFVWNNVLVAADILVREETGWHLYEVKSSLSISATYIRDAALQYYIIGKSGLAISGVSIIHLDKEYVFDGERDLKRLFKTENITGEAFKAIDEVIPGLISARRTLLRGIIPDISMGIHCMHPYPCDFRGYCSNGRIPEQSVLDLSELEEEKRWELVGKDILKIKDIPDEFPLTDIQKIEIRSKLDGITFSDPEKINKILDGVTESPLFLDLQVFRAAVPVVLQTRPYQQVPFAFSILSHSDDLLQEPVTMIARPDSNLEESFLTDFITATGSAETIIVNGRHWQLRALIKSATRFPDMHHQLERLTSKVIDISEIFSMKYYYHPEMKDYTDVRHLNDIFGGMGNLPGYEIGSDDQAGTAFEYLFNEQDVSKQKKVKLLLQQYVSGNVLALRNIYNSLTELSSQ